MRAVITGITGFLGTHLAEHLLGCGDTVLGVSRRSAWPSEFAEVAGLASIPLVPWNLADDSGQGAIPDETRSAIIDFDPDVIFHFAALSHPNDCGQITPNALAMQINVDGVQTIAGVVQSLPNPPRLVFASTGHVYARPVCGSYVHEESLLEPSRGYGMTKLAAERVLRSATTSGKLEAVIARSFQHAGPRQDPRLMLAEWASQVAAGRPGPIRVFNRNTMIDLTDGKDAAAAYRELALHGRAGQVYNIGAGTAQRTGDILDMLLSFAETKHEVIEAEPGFRRNLIADISRITHETSWQPRVSIETTVRNTLQWWRTRIAAAENRAKAASAAKLGTTVS